MNGQKFSRISHEDACLILKSSLINYKANSLPIKIAVRYLGKLPILKPTDAKSTSDKIDSSIKVISKDIQIKLEKLKSPEMFTLLKNSLADLPKDLNLFKYFLIQYILSRINIQYFVYLVENRVKISRKVVDSNQKYFSFKYSFLNCFF